MKTLVSTIAFATLIAAAPALAGGVSDVSSNAAVQRDTLAIANGQTAAGGDFRLQAAPRGGLIIQDSAAYVPAGSTVDSSR